ncbi:MAG: ABC transporter ATP-binding protein/permease [Oscillospiraceae bacterium]|nr:ABC transporter ATP-binding protein/permease [Oscillospiraceae bacterium]
MENKKYNVLSAVAICAKCAPAATIANVILNVISGILAPVMVYVVAVFVDSAVTLTSSEPHTKILLISIAAMVIWYTYNQLSPVLGRLLTKNTENKLKIKLRPLMVKKQASLNFESMENDKTLDLIEFVSQNTEAKFVGVMSSFISSMSLVIQMAGILSILLSYVWWVPLIFLFGAVPLIVLSFKGGKKIYKSYKKVSVLSRTMNYLSEILCSRESSAERTLFGYTKAINEKFRITHLKRSNLNTKTIAVEMTQSKACSIALNIFVLIAMFSMINQVADKTISIGLYISITGAMINLIGILSNALSQLIYDLSEYIEYFKDFTRFFALPGNENVLEYTKNNANFEGMIIKNLWFKYKDTDDYVLKGVNLHIEKGKSYSLIGKNGAGKTTLTKIITGLYRDFEGEIIVNGRDIKEYGLSELRDIFSVVYQDYAKYYISLSDNITFGADSDNFEELAKIVELDGVTGKLPQGKKTPLGKIFDNGTDISAGEWQKIAIARSVYRDCPFMVLDEPTASLSPMTETKIYNKFAEISAGHTLLLISHRLGSTKLSEKLLVLDGGKIAEEGSHGELIQKNGIYAEMFGSQRSWYDE